MTDDTLAPVVCFDSAKVSQLRAALPPACTLRDTTDLLKAVAHPGRLAVLSLVAREECCVCDVAHTLRLPISTASQHLTRLRRAGLLEARQEGRMVLYSLAGHPVTEVLLALVAQGAPA